MVTFERIESDGIRIKYRYYPENRRSAKPGLIIVDRETKTINVADPAEEDIYVVQTADQQNAARDTINQERVNQGLEPLTEEEWPLATRDIACYVYAAHAIKELSKKYSM